MRYNSFKQVVDRFRSSDAMWSVHNIVGHPLMEIFRLIGFVSVGEKIHDATLPLDPIDTRRT